MLTARRYRVVGVAIITIVLIFVLYSSNNADINANKHVTLEKLDNKASEKFQSSNNIIDSKNNDKIDEAINQQISKNGKEGGSGSKMINQQEENSSENQDFDPVKELIQIRSLGPMIVFSKTGCPFSLRIKKLLQNYQITPEPQFVELDKHQHGRELQAYLKEATGRGTVPNVLVGKSIESRGGADDFINLDKENELVSQLKIWGQNSIDVKKLNTPSNF